MRRLLTALLMVFLSISLSTANAADESKGLGKAWDYYDNARYEEAAGEFGKSLPVQSLRNEAMLGLGYTRMRLGQKAEAIKLFKELQRLNYKGPETAPALIGLLLEESRTDEAFEYLSGVRDSERPLWRRRVLGIIAGDALNPSSPNAKDMALSFVTKYERELGRCQTPELFMKAAETLIMAREGAAGIKVLDTLGRACGLGYSASKPGMLKVAVLKKAIPMIPSHEPEHAQLQAELDEAMLGAYALRSAIGWYFFNAGDVGNSAAIFNSLNADQPENSEYGLGLALSLREVDDRRVEAIAEKFLGAREEFRGILRDALMRRARAAYDAGRYADALPPLGRVLELDPVDREARVLYAWSLHHEGRRKEALPLLEALYDEEPDPGLWRLLFDSALAEADRTRGIRLARKAGESGNPEMTKPAAQYLNREGCPMLAAEMDSTEGACYQGAHTSYTEAFGGYRKKSGTEGLSRLNDYAAGARYVHPIGGGRGLKAEIEAHSLSSGDAASGALVGSPYLGGSGSPDSSASVYEARVGYLQEGAIGIDAELGAAPIGGRADQAPVYRLALKAGGLDAALYQDMVRESILSYSGIKDPYSGRTWGRVLKSGLSAAYRMEPIAKYSLSINAALERYRGENVGNNASQSTGASFGRSFDIEAGNLYAGLYITHMRFEHDQNHFTFGHGGYFSPSSFLTAGLSMSYSRKPCGSTAFDVSGALGWLSHSSGPAAYYPLDKSAPPDYYPREDVSSVGASAEVRWLKLLGRQWAAGCALAYDRSADYSEARVMAMLVSYSHLRASVALREDDMRFRR